MTNDINGATRSIAYDSINGGVYYSTVNEFGPGTKFGYYNKATNNIEDLTFTLPDNTSQDFVNIAFDSKHNGLYIVSFSDSILNHGRFFHYFRDTNSTIDLTDKLPDPPTLAPHSLQLFRVTYDSINDGAYIGTYGNSFPNNGDNVSILTSPFSSARSLSYSKVSLPSVSRLNGTRPAKERLPITNPPACVDQALALPAIVVANSASSGY